MADDLFEKIVGKVKPVKSKKRVVREGAPVKEENVGNQKKMQTLRQAQGEEKRIIQKTKTILSDLMVGDVSGLDGGRAKKFKRGQMEIDGKLDLHGMTQDEAFAALVDFIPSARAAGKRCVLIVTGKGKMGQGVLKENLPGWLNQPQNRPHILSFSPAQVQHGGDGAMYVLLKKR